jgi:sulfhydrogenase subunit beta (sulfur reductase)
MSLTEHADFARVVIEKDSVQSLLDALQARKYELYGPTVRDDAVVYDTIASVDDFPVGLLDRQSPGKYGLARNRTKTLFAYVVGPHSWKRFFYPSRKKVLEAKRDGRKIEIIDVAENPPCQALIGVRACELHALQIMDKVLTEGPYTDEDYKNRRQNAFIVAVNCTRAGGNCFCDSMKTGPKAQSGFDLALTEIADTDRHYFVVEVGSKAGSEIIADIPHTKASKEEIAVADQSVRNAATRMGRTLDTKGLPELLARNFDNPRWEETAGRCLTCGNCTLVCPTCFCMTVEDTTDLTGSEAERWRRWDVCYTVDFSYIHGGSIRASAKSRYRQWMMHKLAYWPGQFGTFGCVGCGRCITWCPVGIDITEEAREIQKSE